jgi:hypothetical protein
VPIGVVPRQARDLESHDDAGVAHADVGGQTLKTSAPSRRRSRLALVVIDDDDLIIAPAERDGSAAKCVLTFPALNILENLPRGRLPNLQVRSPFEMVRLDFQRLAHVVVPPCQCSWPWLRKHE